ncbi:MAG: pentapeptide repeat-containing protein [Cyanobacteria bacterium J06621_11]
MSRNALIVGISHYQHLLDLRAPVADAEAIAQQLEQDSDFKVQRLPERIIEAADGNKKPSVSPTQQVTQLQLMQALEQLFLPSSQQVPETALFYFSGHGIASHNGHDKGYLATSDTEPKNPALGLSLGWLHWLLSESPIKQQIVWLDCCHSGSLIVNVDAANPGSDKARNRCFIASSRDFESSWEDLNSPYSVLTKALLDGLNPTRFPGNQVNSFDLVAHVSRALKGDLQTPVCTSFGEAIDLTRRWQVAEQTETTPEPDSGICPYKGLEFFDWNNDDPQYFFGRERLVSQLIDHVRTQSFLALVGASGNGKSSVLRAGLLHQLQLGERVVGSEQWQILVTRPDADPMKNLAAAFVPDAGTQLDKAEAIGRAEGLLKEGSAGLQRLVQASSALRTVLVIDQFEEIFTRCALAAERRLFFECLMGALSACGDQLCLVIAMRADFVGKCLAQDYAGLAQQIQDHMISVLPLTAAELQTAICKPTQQVGLTVEPELVTAIVKDTKDAPGSLPLLQYTLKALWQRRADSQLRLTDYLTLGGIEGTLDQRATEIYNCFNDAEQQTVQHLFQQLTQLGEGTEDTRRRVFLENLIAEPRHPAERVRSVVETLSNAENRLLVTSEVVSKGSALERRAIVDVAHEALIRHWRLLRQWIEQNRDLLRQQRRIEASTVAWQEQGEAKGYLLQGIPLVEAVQFRNEQVALFPLSDVAKAFIQKSVWHRRWSRLKAASWLILPAVLIVGLVEYNLREASVKADYARLDNKGGYEEKQAVQDLVTGCARSRGVVQNYFLERLFSNCRSLNGAPLADASLRAADLRYARLIAANLRYANLIAANLHYASLSAADLISAYFSYADLRYADFRYADLSDADFRYADLSAADLRYANLIAAIFLNTNLRTTKNLESSQLTGENSSLICNSPLPEGLELENGTNRDCDRLPAVLLERYPNRFETLDAAKAYVTEQREQKQE